MAGGRVAHTQGKEARAVGGGLDGGGGGVGGGGEERACGGVFEQDVDFEELRGVFGVVFFFWVLGLGLLGDFGSGGEGGFEDAEAGGEDVVARVGGPGGGRVACRGGDGVAWEGVDVDFVGYVWGWWLAVYSSRGGLELGFTEEGKGKERERKRSYGECVQSRQGGEDGPSPGP